MKIEYQICSLELAKRLKELGVAQDSHFMWKYDESYYIVAANSRYGVGNGIVASAFTVAELGEMLPRCCFGAYLNIFRDPDGWAVGYGLEFTEKATSEADARAKMLIYLIENGRIEVPRA